MVDYVIFDVVRAAITDAVAYGKEIGFNTGAITVEVKNLPKANSVSNIHEFVLSESMTVGAFNNRDKVDFLRKHIHDAHVRHLKGENVAPTGWGPDTIKLGYKTLYFADEPSDYSIVVGVMGGGSEINSAIVDAILKDLPDKPRA